MYHLLDRFIHLESKIDYDIDIHKLSYRVYNKYLNVRSLGLGTRLQVGKVVILGQI